MRMHMEKKNVAITVEVSDESFFVNGIKQNAIILRDCLLQTDVVNECYYLNLGSQRDLTKSPWKEYEKYIIHDFKEALEKIDLFISVCVSLNDPEIRAIKARGGKIVKAVMGNEYYIFSEKVLFQSGDVSSVIRKGYGIDASWISPHIYETNKDLYEALFDSPAYVSPYIWSPQFLMGHVEELKNAGFATTYQPTTSKKRVCTFEPNISMNKTSIFPIVIAEKYHSLYPDEIGNFTMFGTSEIKKKKTFVNFASGLNVHKNKQLFFESRYPIAWSLLKHTDILLSHQQDLALNYLYFDAAWLGFPVVHNADFVPELGWYYKRYDAETAIKHIHEIVKVFDHVPGYREEYMAQSREYISKFLPKHSRNIQGYQDLIYKLYEKK